MEHILVKELALDNNLVLLAGTKGLNEIISDENIQRPGLEFAGFFDRTKRKTFRIFSDWTPDQTRRKTMANEMYIDTDYIVTRLYAQRLQGLFLFPWQYQSILSCL